jgi:hypothetical protein
MKNLLDPITAWRLAKLSDTGVASSTVLLMPSFVAPTLAGAGIGALIGLKSKHALLGAVIGGAAVGLSAYALLSQSVA